MKESVNGNTDDQTGSCELILSFYSTSTLYCWSTGCAELECVCFVLLSMELWNSTWNPYLLFTVPQDTCTDAVWSRWSALSGPPAHHILSDECEHRWTVPVEFGYLLKLAAATFHPDGSGLVEAVFLLSLCHFGFVTKILCSRISCCTTWFRSSWRTGWFLLAWHSAKFRRGCGLACVEMLCIYTPACSVISSCFTPLNLVTAMFLSCSTLAGSLCCMYI